MESSQHLVRQASQGNAKALQELVVLHLPALRGYVRLRMGTALRQFESTSDVVQSVCREILGDLDDFEYRGEGAFRRWLFNAAERKIRDRARYWARAKRAGARSLSPDADPRLVEVLDAYASFVGPSQEVEALEELARIERAFDGLSESYRRVILLRQLVGLSTEEVAHEIGLSTHATRTLLSRALARLTTLLGGRAKED